MRVTGKLLAVALAVVASSSSFATGQRSDTTNFTPTTDSSTPSTPDHANGSPLHVDAGDVGSVAGVAGSIAGAAGSIAGVAGGSTGGTTCTFKYSMPTASNVYATKKGDESEGSYAGSASGLSSIHGSNGYGSSGSFSMDMSADLDSASMDSSISSGDVTIDQKDDSKKGGSSLKDGNKDTEDDSKNDGKGDSKDDSKKQDSKKEDSKKEESKSTDNGSSGSVTMPPKKESPAPTTTSLAPSADSKSSSRSKPTSSDSGKEELSDSAKDTNVIPGLGDGRRVRHLQLAEATGNVLKDTTDRVGSVADGTKDATDAVVSTASSIIGGVSDTVVKVPSTLKGTTDGVSSAVGDLVGSLSSDASGSAGGSVAVDDSSSKAIEFSCDAKFYGAWNKLGLTCNGNPLDAEEAASMSECLVYSGVHSGMYVTDMNVCMSLCRFPACDSSTGTWDYASDDGFKSSIYEGLDLLSLLSASEDTTGIVKQPFTDLNFTSNQECAYKGDGTFSECQCSNILSRDDESKDGNTNNAEYSAFTVPENRGLEDHNHWADGTKKTELDKTAIGTAYVGGTAAISSVAISGAMGVASAAGTSLAAAPGTALMTAEFCQFGVMMTQMNLDRRPRLMDEMGKYYSASTFGFLKNWDWFQENFKDVTYTEENGSAAKVNRRRLADSNSGSSGSEDVTEVQGMEKYAKIIGVREDMLFYLTAAGVMALIAALGVAYGLLLLCAAPFVSDFAAFAKKWRDKAVGVLMMILILSEYAIGVTATYQFCYCIDHNQIDASLFLSIACFLFGSVGTICYGVYIVRKHEDQLRDLGTADHFEKPVHAKYGPLYDQYKFEGRFFFAPKLLLALLSGVTTGLVWVNGIWQIVILIALNLAFLFYMETKQPYPTRFVHRTTTFVSVIKISALFLTVFLASSALSFSDSIPVDLREGVGFAVVGLQALVLLALMIRQVYIFYRTWKLKKEGYTSKEINMAQGRVPDSDTSTRPSARDPYAARHDDESYFTLEKQGNGSMAIMEEDRTPMSNHQSYVTPVQPGYAHQSSRSKEVDL